MARIVLKCPIDGTNLGATNLNIDATVKGVLAIEVGDHNHLAIVFDLTCSNGHRWIANTELLVERVA